jgi:glycosyltransferase involved in cell wall biosynthesis
MKALSRSSLRVSKPSSLRIIWSETMHLDLSLSKTTELEILNALSNLNHDVEFIAMRSGAYDVKGNKVRLTLVPVRNFKIVASVAFSIIQTLLLLKRMVSSKIDVIITEPGTNFLGFIPLLIVRKFTKTIFVLDIRSTPVEVFGLPGFLEKFCFNLSVLIAKKHFDGLTIITPLMRDEICEKYSVEPNLVGVWPSGVSLSTFSMSNTSREDLRKKLGLVGKFVIMYHGFIAGDRGLRETVDAIGRLKSNYPDIVLFFLGSGSYASELKTKVSEMALDNSVVVHDAVDYSDVSKFIAMSDVGIVPLPDIPQWRHQCPLKILEYLAMGKPVILTSIPAHRAIIGDEKCGIFLRSSEPEEIAKSIVLAYENKDKLPVWGQKGISIANEYSWDKVAKDLNDYLEKIIVSKSACQP